MGFRDFITSLWCDCTKEDNGNTKVIVHIKGNRCCNRRKLVINMGGASVAEVEGVLRRLESEGSAG